MITVITPTYNRAYILENAYNSLCKQLNKDFEWIIIDDGSTDNTSELVKGWLKNTLFKIRYYRQNNGGKHRALNFAVAKSKGDYILILDSDDTLTPDAIKFLYEHLDEIKGNEFAGIAGLKKWNNKTGIVGNQTEDNSFIDATNIERIKYKLNGDKAELYKKSILLKYPFPEFESENFLAEGASWNKIAMDGYKIRWYQHAIYECSYLEDGLTKNNNDQKLIDNFRGYTYNTKINIQINPLLYRFLSIGMYHKVAKKKGYSSQEICKLIEINKIELCIGIIFRKLHDIKKRN